MPNVCRFGVALMLIQLGCGPQPSTDQMLSSAPPTGENSAELAGAEALEAARPGSRIKPIRYRGVDGARLVDGSKYLDTLYDEDCVIDLDFEGTLRCLPLATGQVYPRVFEDSGCTLLVASPPPRPRSHFVRLRDFVYNPDGSSREVHEYFLINSEIKSGRNRSFYSQSPTGECVVSNASVASYVTAQDNVPLSGFVEFSRR